MSQEDFDKSVPEKQKILAKSEVFDEEDDVTLEETFPELRLQQSGVHVRGAKMAKKGGNLAQDKKIARGNKKKRDKARRLYADSSYWYVFRLNFKNTIIVLYTYVMSYYFHSKGVGY